VRVTREQLGRIIKEEATRLQETPRRRPESAKKHHAQRRAAGREWEQQLIGLVDAAMADVTHLPPGEKAAAADELEKKLDREIRLFVEAL
jgi:hypothetical protein